MPESFYLLVLLAAIVVLIVWANLFVQRTKATMTDGELKEWESENIKEANL